jgi:hypothetical protein
VNNFAAIENTSGSRKDSVVPPQVKGWNWGAFFLNWIWGLGNSTYIALLMFVPVVNFIMPFVLGAKGSEWAWRNQAWRDVEHFKKTQRNWGLAGALIMVVLLPTCVAAPITLMKHSDGYKLSLSEIQQHQEVKAVLGEQIQAGLFITGGLSTSGPDGHAALQYSIKGSKGKGEAYVHAVKQIGEWRLQMVAVDVADKRIIVVDESLSLRGRP